MTAQDKEYEHLLNFKDGDINERQDFVPEPVDIGNIKEGPNILEVVDIFGTKKEDETVKKAVNPKEREPLWTPAPGGKPAPPAKITCFMYFFCMFRKFFEVKDGVYQEISMNPLPPPMRSYNVTRQYLGELDKRTKIMEDKREDAIKKSPNLEDTEFATESYWDLSKTLAIVKPTLVLACKYRFIQNGCEFSMPFFMRFYLKELKQSAEDGRRAWFMCVLALGATIACFVGGMCRERANFYTGATKAKAGQALRCLVYKRLAQADFMFLLNVNAGLVARFGMFEVDGILGYIGGISDMISSPVYVFLTFAYLIFDVGAPALMIIVILLAFLSILCYLNFTVVNRWRAFSNQGNERAVALRELIPNIDEVKKCGFEDFFHCKLNGKRNNEMGALKSMHSISNLLNFCFELTFLIGAFLNVYLFISSQPVGTELDTGTTFSQIAMVNGMRGNFREIMEIVVNYNEYYLSKVSMDLQLNKVQIKPEESLGYIDKTMETGHIKGQECEFGINDKEHIEICDFLKKSDVMGGSGKETLDVYEKLQEVKDEIDEEAIAEKKKKNVGQMSDPNSQFANTTVVFNQKSFEVEPAQKVCICGAEDDGKSMFIFSLLGETELMNGSLKYNGTMGMLSFKRAAFVSGTVRDNITLFSRYYKKLYEKACEIGNVNTARMPGDDFMMVSDSGSNLFPKEKMQILVARLVYQNPDIMIIDDFFDYLTPQLRDIYSNLILKYCREKNKTLIYVSAYESLAKKSDKIFYFNNCNMVEDGSYETLKHKPGGAFAEFIQKRPDSRPKLAKKTTRERNFNVPPWIEELGILDEDPQDHHNDDRLKARQANKGDILAQKLDIKQEENSGGGGDVENAIVNLMKISIKRRDGNVLAAGAEFQLGSLKETLLKKYLCIEGPKRLIWQIFVGFISVIASFTIDIWLILIAMKKLASIEIMVQIYLWGVIALISSFVIWFRDSNIRFSMMENSNTLYRRCIKKVLCTRMDWFQKNSSSGLVYILTEDITKIDFYFNEAKMKLIEVIFNQIIAFFVCNYLLWILMTIPLAIGLYLFYPYFTKYLMAVQHFYKLEQTTKAELLSMYLQTYEGAIMFRNMGMPRFFDNRFVDATETFQKATTHLNNVCGRFIGVRNFILNTYFVFQVYFIPIIIKEFIHKSTTSLWLSDNWMTPLAVSWTYKLIRYCNNQFGILAALSKYIISIKRAEDFLEHEFIEDLDPGKIDCTAQIDHAIEMKNASMSYGFNSKSQWDLNWNIEKGKKIAIVGQSYSGKHSMINMLQKLYERIDQDEVDSRIKKEHALFENSRKWFNEHFDDIEKENPDKYPKKGSHPDRAFPNDRGDAFQIWAGFVTKIEEEGGEAGGEGEGVSDSYVKVLGQELTACSPFELRRHISYLSPKAMMYNGTILENIDFAGEFKDNKWKIVKIQSYLGFFNALISSMNLDDALDRFREEIFDPAINIKEDDLNKELLEMESPLKKQATPVPIPKNETEKEKQKREKAEEKKQQEDIELNKEIEKAMVKQKSIDLFNLEQVYEDTQRDNCINKNYDVAAKDENNSPLKKMSRFDLMDIYNRNQKFEMTNINIEVNESNVSGMNNMSEMKPLTDSYVPPTAGKRGRKGKSEADQMKEDQEKIKDLMKKIYDGENVNQYTKEDVTLLKLAEEDWIYDKCGFDKSEKNPIAETLKDYLGSRLSYHRADQHEAMIIHDILEAEVKPNGENFGHSLRKIINAARAILNNKAILMCDDDALIAAESPTLLDDVFNELKDSTIVTVVNDFENLLYFDKVIVINEGFIAEEGDPKELLTDKSSQLFMTMKKVDKGLAKIIEDSKEIKKWSDKQVFETYFKIPSWFKKLGYNVPLFENKQN